MAKKGWTWAPSRMIKPKVPDNLKAEVLSNADELVEEFLKPNFIKKPPKKPRWNYTSPSTRNGIVPFSTSSSRFAALAQQRSRQPSRLPSPPWNLSGSENSTWPICGTPASGGKFALG
jgi:hypothetical protein